MLTVSNYHYIRENFESNYPSIFGVKPSEFKNQLELLRNEGDFITPNGLVSNLQSILESKENFILVTFDDGLKEQYELALPILDEMEIPAIFFANSMNSQDKKVTVVHKIHLLRSILAPEILLGNIAKFNSVYLSEEEKVKAQNIYRFDEPESAALKYLLNFKMSFSQQEVVINELFKDFFDEKEVFKDLYMNDSELISLAEKGYLGSHSHSHFPIGLLDEKTIYFELENCKSYFENLTKSKIELVSYPYGTEEAATLQVAEIAQKIGYKAGFTTKKGINKSGQNNLLLDRFDCNDLVGGKNYTK